MQVSPNQRHYFSHISTALSKELFLNSYASPFKGSFQKSLWCLIPNNGSAQSFMLPQRRAHSTLLRCSNFSTLILGIIMVHDTKKWISICFHGVGSFLHFHSIGTSPFFFEESLWRLIPNNGSALYFTLPRRKTLFTLLRCRNFSSPVLGIVVVVDPKERISSIFYAST